MFFNFRNDEKKVSFLVKDLYVGLLGYVTSNGSMLHIDKTEKIIIFRKIEHQNGVDYCAENIFTGQQYFFFHGNIDYSQTIDLAIRSYAIFSFVPLEMVFREPKVKVSKNELLQLYYEESLAISGKEKEVDDKEQPVTDPILQTILKTADLVKDSRIEVGLKNELVLELESLGENYVYDMVEILEQQNTLVFDKNEYTVRMKYIKKLVEVEARFHNIEDSKGYSLKKELVNFKKKLK